MMERFWQKVYEFLMTAISSLIVVLVLGVVGFGLGLLFPLIINLPTTTIVLLILFGISALIFSGVLLHTLASNNILVTYPLTEQFIFIKRGEYLHTVVGVIPGNQITKGKVTEDDVTGKLQDYRTTPPSLLDEFLWWAFRMQWIGIPGFRSVHQFEIEAKRMRSRPLGENVAIGERLVEIDPEKKRVWSLRRRFVRPIIVTQVELPEDNAGINFVIGGVFIVLNPLLPIFGLGGDFMTILEKAVSQAVTNACKKPIDPNESEFLSFKKLQGLEFGVGSDFTKGITEEVNSGIETQLGIKLESLNIEGWEADKNTVTLANSQQKEAIAQAEAREKKAQALGEADKITIVGQAKADEVKMMADAQAKRVETLKSAGLKDQQIAVILANEALPQGISTFTSPGTVNVEGVQIGNNEGGYKP